MWQERGRQTESVGSGQNCCRGLGQWVSGEYRKPEMVSENNVQYERGRQKCIKFSSSMLGKYAMEDIVLKEDRKLLGKS